MMHKIEVGMLALIEPASWETEAGVQGYPRYDTRQRAAELRHRLD